jgi:carbonic anhydrase/acetyltransferase-like protein (isoleucine patch superfamily)
MKPSKARTRPIFVPGGEQVEKRVLLTLPNPALRAILTIPPSTHLVRPNTPVAPFGAPTSAASFIDPTAQILHGDHALIGNNSYIGPDARIDASGSGFVKIGSGSGVLDNALVVGNPSHDPRVQSAVLLGNLVSVGPNATVLGPSTIGAFGKAAQPTIIGAGALIDGATIQPGAIVGDLARVGPGVTVPTGYEVLPGRNVTTNAEASNPQLGYVTTIPLTDKTNALNLLSFNVALAAGYTTLYQGNPATGVTPALPNASASSGPFNGNLATVLGASQEPGTSKEPGKFGPRWQFPHNTGLIEADTPNFPARVIGLAIFADKPRAVARGLSPHTSIRADQGQPIQFADGLRTGRHATIFSPVQGALNIGQNLQLGAGAVLLGGPRSTPAAYSTIGNNVVIGPGSVVDSSSLGDNATIGAHTVIVKSFLPAGTVVPDNTIMVNNVIQGPVQW